MKGQYTNFPNLLFNNRFVRHETSPAKETPAEPVSEQEDEWLDKTYISEAAKAKDLAEEQSRITFAEYLRLIDKVIWPPDRDPKFCSLAENPKAPIWELEILAKDKSHEVRRSVALNVNAPVSLLVKLSDDKHPRVWSGVAINKNTPIHILAEIAEKNKELLRSRNWSAAFDIDRALAGNENTPQNILSDLAEDHDEDIRMIVAQNINTPSNALKKLMKDKDRHHTARWAKETYDKQRHD